MKTFILLVTLVFSFDILASAPPSFYKQSSKCDKMKEKSISYDIDGSFRKKTITGVISFTSKKESSQHDFLSGNLVIKDAAGKTLDEGSFDTFKSLCRDNGGKYSNSIILSWSHGSIYSFGISPFNCYVGWLNDKYISTSGIFHFCVKAHHKKGSA